MFDNSNVNKISPKANWDRQTDGQADRQTDGKDHVLSQADNAI